MVRCQHHHGEIDPGTQLLHDGSEHLTDRFGRIRMSAERGGTTLVHDTGGKRVSGTRCQGPRSTRQWAKICP